MTRILIPVDVSENSTKAVRHAANMALQQAGIEVHLLHVRAPLPQYISRFINKGERKSWHAAEAERALAPARELLDRHGVAHAQHVERGEVATTIDRVDGTRLKLSDYVLNLKEIGIDPEAKNFLVQQVMVVLILLLRTTLTP